MDRSSRQFEEYLRRRRLKLTRDRLCAAQAVAACKRHFRVGDVEAVARKRGMHIHRATLYRTLPLLIDAGIIKRIHASRGDRPQYEREFGRKHHDHLLCIGCGKVIEARCDRLERQQKALCERYGFLALDHRLCIRGYCGDCRARSQRGLAGSDARAPVEERDDDDIRARGGRRPCRRLRGGSSGPTA